jgi:hypothetical protein
LWWGIKEVGSRCASDAIGVSERSFYAWRRQQQIALSDGGSGLEEFFRINFPLAMCILDVWHANAYLVEFGKALFGEESAEARPGSTSAVINSSTLAAQPFWPSWSRQRHAPEAARQQRRLPPPRPLPQRTRQMGRLLAQPSQLTSSPGPKNYLQK